MMVQKVKGREDKRLSFFKILFICIIAGSCSSKIKIKSPSSRFISPETGGRVGKGGIHFESQGSTHAELDLNASSTKDPLTVSRRNALSVQMDLGIIEKFDFFYKSNNDTTGIYGIKFQISGESRKKAKSGNTSLAVTIAYGSEGRGISNDYGPNDIDDVTISESILDFSVIYGKRISEKTLLYTSFYKYQQKLEFELETERYPTFDGEKVKLKNNVYGFSIGSFYYFNRALYGSLEVSGQQTNWTNNPAKKNFFIGGAIGINW